VSGAEILKPFGSYRTPGIDENVVETLENLLERAVSGEITGVAVAYMTGGNHACSEVAFGSAGYAAMLGATVAMQATMLEAWKNL